MSIEAIATTERDELFRHHVVPHIPALLAAARQSTQQLADAEDLVQDTLVSAYRAIHRFDGSHPRAWLMTILRNTRANAHRRRRPELLRDPDTDLESLGETGPHDSAESLALDAAFDEAVHRAFHTLSARQRAVVTLVDIEGLSYAQAAAQLGIPEGTVMSRLHGARTRMRKLLGAASVIPKRGHLQ
jgi:RNA polymerase sigma-70 factor (ECF subfamily)